jgi:hypothetical protein
MGGHKVPFEMPGENLQKCPVGVSWSDSAEEISELHRRWYNPARFRKIRRGLLEG